MTETTAGAPIGETPAAPQTAVETTTVATATSFTPAEATPTTTTNSAVTAASETATSQAQTSEEEPPVKEGDWSALREKIAKGDEKLSKRLARYSSVESVVEALIAAQAKISDGSLKTVLPKDATPEQIATWREENGIPSEAKDYDLTMPDGLIIGEEDKPVVDDFIKTAHELNMTPTQAKTAVAWYLNKQEQAADEQAASDLEAKEAGLEALTEAWGSEARLNKSLITNLINQAPGGEETAQLILHARLGDGTPLGSNPNVLRWLADVARTVNPTATVVPGSGANASQAIETELADITKLMGDKQSDYWKGPKAEKLQARYRQLIDVQQKTQAF